MEGEKEDAPKNNNSDLNPNASSFQPMKKKSPRVCKFFQSGTSRYGEACRFTHTYKAANNNTALKPKISNNKSKSKMNIKKASSSRALGARSFFDDDDEGACFGFSGEDVMELAAQGVKPWDSDPSDVLFALNGGFDY